jgi:alpha-glucuronidase
MISGRTLWEELCYKYTEGVDSVEWMLHEWMKMKDLVDEERYEHVKALLHVQAKEARWWRDACILYFQKFSGKPIPVNLDKPLQSLEYYEGMRFYYVPGI